MGSSSTSTVGLSIRALPNASIFGADVDRRILFTDGRIQTRFVDQTKPYTFDEMGLPTLSLFQAWFGLFAPKGTPNEVIGKLNAAAVDALADPTVRSRLADLGQQVLPREQQTPDAGRGIG